MGEIAGNASVLIASECLSNLNDGKGLLFGGVSGVGTTDVVVILGAGTVGEFAARSALGLGASVRIFDNSLYKLRRIQDKLNTRVYTNMINPKVLEKSVRRADVLIGAIRSKTGRTPCVINKEMVKLMKTGSVIIDVSIDGGGCVETSELTSHKSPTFIKHGVIHYCVNIPSRVARTASFSLSNIFTSLLLNIGEYGGVNKIIHNKPKIGQGAYIVGGKIVNKGISEIFNLPYKIFKFLNFSIRFFYFSFGVVFGSVILLFSLQLRKEPIKFNYLPNSRVINHISNHDIIFSENISCKVDCISLDIRKSTNLYISIKS